MNVRAAARLSTLCVMRFSPVVLICVSSPLSFSLSIADGTSLPAQLLQWTRAVLTPAVFTRFGADAIDTWGVEAFDQLLDAWTALVGATESPALSPGEAAAALAALAEPTQEVVETYVGLRLAQAADEAVRGENDVAERFHGGGDGAAGSAFGDFLESLARLGRVCPERCLKAVGDAIAERVQRLRGLAESAAAAGCADGEELEQQALVCHEGLAWLFEFLSHVLCDVGAQQGETPLIPTAMVAASRRHCEAVAAGIGADLRGVGAALNAALRQRQATMGPAALDGIEATGEGQAAVAAAQAVGEAAAPSDPVVSALAGVLAYAEFENQVLTASVRAEPRMGGGRGMSLEVGGMGGGAGATSPGSTSSSIEFHTDKPPLVSPYVGAALLRLLSRWAGTYLAPNQLHYTSLLGGDLVGAIDPSLAATQQPQQQLAEEAGQLQGLRHFALPSPALWVAGREDSQAAAQTVQLLIDKAQVRSRFPAHSPCLVLFPLSNPHTPSHPSSPSSLPPFPRRTCCCGARKRRSPRRRARCCACWLASAPARCSCSPRPSLRSSPRTASPRPPMDPSGPASLKSCRRVRSRPRSNTPRES